jgi:hypothetical protein
MTSIHEISIFSFNPKTHLVLTETRTCEKIKGGDQEENLAKFFSVEVELP